jgi:hypothetical protein
MKIEFIYENETKPFKTITSTATFKNGDCTEIDEQLFEVININYTVMGDNIFMKVFVKSIGKSFL